MVTKAAVGMEGKRRLIQNNLLDFFFSLSSFVSLFPGDVLFQMAEVHRQIQNQLEEMVSTCVVINLSFCRAWPRGSLQGL